MLLALKDYSLNSAFVMWLDKVGQFLHDYMAGPVTYS